MASSANRAPRDPAWRMRIAASMQGNTNAARSRFSNELEGTYKDDPEVLAWIQENQKALDAPNNDGVIVYSDAQIRDSDSKFTFLE